MVYIFVFIALLCLTVKGYCGKKTSSYVKDTGDSFLFNLVRMLLCTVIGLALILIEGSVGYLSIEKDMLLICLLSGLCNAAFLIGWLLAIQKNAMVTVDVTLTIGSLLPAILCAWLFGEAFSPLKLIGYGLIILAAIILSGYSRSVMSKPGLSGIIFLIIGALGDGLTGFCQQLYRQYYTADGQFADGTLYPKSVYQFYTYVFAALILLVTFAGCAAYRLLKSKKEERHGYVTEIFSSLKKPLPHIFIMAICLFAAAYFQTAATSDYGMSSQILYPLMKGGCLITVTLTATLFFGEKPNKRSIIGSLTALVGIVAINFL